MTTLAKPYKFEFIRQYYGEKCQYNKYKFKNIIESVFNIQSVGLNIQNDVLNPK